MTKGAIARQVWLHNAAAVYIPFVVLFALAAWVGLRSVPVTANMREQMDI